MSLVIRIAPEVTRLDVWRSDTVMRALRALMAEGVRLMDEPQAYDDPGASAAFAARRYCGGCHGCSECKP